MEPQYRVHGSETILVAPWSKSTAYLYSWNPTWHSAGPSGVPHRPFGVWLAGKWNVAREIPALEAAGHADRRGTGIRAVGNEDPELDLPAGRIVARLPCAATLGHVPHRPNQPQIPSRSRWAHRRRPEPVRRRSPQPLPEGRRSVGDDRIASPGDQS
jgi:hypothetical protein